MPAYKHNSPKKKIVKPTSAEQRIITGRLKRKYPQMYEPAISPGTKKQLGTVRGAADRKALERMVAKKLKKIYGGK